VKDWHEVQPGLPPLQKARQYITPLLTEISWNRAWQDRHCSEDTQVAQFFDSSQGWQLKLSEK
jgi:hypothetical protein